MVERRKRSICRENPRGLERRGTLTFDPSCHLAIVAGPKSSQIPAIRVTHATSFIIPSQPRQRSSPFAN